MKVGWRDEGGGIRDEGGGVPDVPFGVRASRDFFLARNLPSTDLEPILQ